MLRINKRKTFLEIASSDKKWIGKSMIMQVLERKDQPESRLGFVITKKLGGAVVRNRVRRRYKSAIFELKDKFKNNYDYVIIGRKAAYYTDYKSIKKDMEQGINSLC